MSGKSDSSSGVDSLEPDERVGTVIADRYRLDALLGEGGMGKVYRAEHVLMRKRLAVKVLHRELTTVPEVVARFEREAMAAANIDHPNVAGATDFGKLSDGSVFLVLEFVQGKNLRDEIAEGPMPIERALSIARQIAAGLGAAHALSIVHRDLKPENVMLIEKGGDPDFVKVLDFGIAKVPIGEGSAMVDGQPITKVGMVFGTPEYMAPEQALGQPVDGRADLYALGVILYEMVSGVRPFSSKSPVGILGQQLAKPAPPFAERSPGLLVPPAAEAIAQKLLAKDVPNRFQHASDVVAAIDVLLGPVAARGELRFTMQSGSPTGVVEPRLASIPDLDPPAVVDFEVPSMPSAPLLSPMPADRLSADDLISAPEPEPPEPSAEVGPTVRPPPLALDRHRKRAEAWLEARRARLPPKVQEALRDVPTAAVLWIGVAIVALGTIGSVVLFISLVTGGPEPAPVASGERVDAPAPTASSAPSPSVAPEPLEEQRTVSELLPLVEKQPNDAELQIALAAAYSAESKHAEAVGAAGKALALDPDRFKEDRIAVVLKAAAQAKPSANAAFALLDGPMGPRGADILFELATDEDTRPEARVRAEKLMRGKRFEQIASPQLWIAVELRDAKSCQQRHGLLLRAKNVGDARALEQLRRLEKTVRCGSDPKAECNACLLGDDRLKQAIAAIEKRQAR
jgi:serine/threonine-protein kinase